MESVLVYVLSGGFNVHYTRQTRGNVLNHDSVWCVNDHGY